MKKEDLLASVASRTTSTISSITDRIRNDIVAWNNRLFESVYLIVCLDGTGFKGTGERQDSLQNLLY